jgi:hypothetical protein
MNGLQMLDVKILLVVVAAVAHRVAVGPRGKRG